MQLTIHAPALNPQVSVPSEAELLGSAVWLWMHSRTHQSMPLQALHALLLPPLRLGQYILAVEQLDNGSRPVAYLGWANLSPEAESRYIANPYHGLQPQDWNSGDRMWMTDYFIPFGRVSALHKRLMALLSQTTFRYLHHRSNEHGVQVRRVVGRQLDKAQAQQWWRERPMLARSQ